MVHLGTMPRRETSRSLAPFLIDAAHPAEYAAQWGDGTTDGAKFYNCCDCDRDGRTIGNPEWTADEWESFVKAIERLQAREWVERPDVAKLATLARWAGYMSGRAASRLPWLASAV